MEVERNRVVPAVQCKMRWRHLARFGKQGELLPESGLVGKGLVAVLAPGLVRVLLRKVRQSVVVQDAVVRKGPAAFEADELAPVAPPLLSMALLVRLQGEVVREGLSAGQAPVTQTRKLGGRRGRVAVPHQQVGAQVLPVVEVAGAEPAGKTGAATAPRCGLVLLVYYVVFVVVVVAIDLWPVVLGSAGDVLLFDLVGEGVEVDPQCAQQLQQLLPTSHLDHRGRTPVQDGQQGMDGGAREVWQ